MNWTYRIGHTLFRALGRQLFDLQVVGAERLPEEGGALLACNHASFLDPPLVGSVFRNEIHYLARKTLFRGPFAWLYPRWNAIPVDQDRADFSSLKAVVRLARSGERVLIFPEGARSDDDRLLPAQPGVGFAIAKAGVPVVPLRLFGTHEALPRGVHWPRIVRVTLVVGEPIVFEGPEWEGKDKGLYRRIAERVMERIAALELPPGREPIRRRAEPVP